MAGVLNIIELVVFVSGCVYLIKASVKRQQAELIKVVKNEVLASILVKTAKLGNISQDICKVYVFANKALDHDLVHRGYDQLPWLKAYKLQKDLNIKRDDDAATYFFRHYQEQVDYYVVHYNGSYFDWFTLDELLSDTKQIGNVNWQHILEHLQYDIKKLKACNIMIPWKNLVIFYNLRLHYSFAVETVSGMRYFYKDLDRKGKHYSSLDDILQY